MSLAAALRAEEHEKQEFRRIVGAFPNSAFDDHPDIVALKARVEAAEKGYFDARAAAPDVDVHGANETLTLVREEIAAKRAALKSMAVDALLGGDTTGDTVADAKAELQRLQWREEALQEGLTGFYARATQLNQDVTGAETVLNAARRALENALRELRYAKAREEMFGDRANTRDILDRFAAPLIQASKYAA